MSSIEHLTPLKAKKAGRLVKMVDSRMRADTRPFVQIHFLNYHSNRNLWGLSYCIQTRLPKNL